MAAIETPAMQQVVGLACPLGWAMEPAVRDLQDRAAAEGQALLGDGKMCSGACVQGQYGPQGL